MPQNTVADVEGALGCYRHRIPGSAGVGTEREDHHSGGVGGAVGLGYLRLDGEALEILVSQVQHVGERQTRREVLVSSQFLNLPAPCQCSMPVECRIPIPISKIQLASEGISRTQLNAYGSA